VDLYLRLDRSRPLRSQLEQQLRQGIRSGRLRAGVRLPSSRLLAGELGVSRGVVVEAYAQLTAEGYLLTQGSGGTRVAELAQPRRQRNGSVVRVKFDLRARLPDTSLFPRRAWSAATSAAIRELPDAGLLYGPAEGQLPLRHALSVYLGRVRAIVTDEEHTFITSGSRHALSMLWSALRASGIQRVAYEDPGWERIPNTILAAGLDPVPIRVDAQGISVTDLYAHKIEAVLVTPAYQYPSGVIMHPARRAQLVRWSLDTGGLIVEDDYDAEYRWGGKPIAPLRSVGGDCVAYLGSTSKALAPGLRLGWLLVPPRLTNAIAEAHSVSYEQPSVIEQVALATLFETGDFDRHLRRARNIYRSRRSALLNALASLAPSLRVTGGSAGLHVMAWLPSEVDEVEFAARALRRGIALDPLHRACAVSRSLGPAVVLGYGAVSASAIPSAISLLAACLNEISVSLRSPALRLVEERVA
jgi:GntR family transcriptional regulator / MocR family aminotransferase